MQSAINRSVEKLIRTHRCPICRKKLGPVKCFIIGPMMAVTRISVEPPAHPECAIEHADQFKTAGVIALWSTKAFNLFPVSKGARVFHIGPPQSIGWQKDGRQATRAEVRESITSALPTLEESCAGDEDIIRLEKEAEELMQLVDATTPA